MDLLTAEAEGTPLDPFLDWTHLKPAWDLNVRGQAGPAAVETTHVRRCARERVVLVSDSYFGSQNVQGINLNI